MTRFVPGNSQREVVLPDAQVKQPPNLTLNADVPHAGAAPSTRAAGSFISVGHLRLALPVAMAHLMDDFRI